MSSARLPPRSPPASNMAGFCNRKGERRSNVAQAAQQLVSSCTLAIVPNLSRGGRSYGVIENVVTHADYRRLGLGRRVLADALDLGWQADCYKVLLATGSNRETTLRFYEGAGFERGGKTYFEVRRP